MAYKDIKRDFDDIKENSEEFFHSSLQYYRLLGFKIGAKAGSAFMTLILLALFLMMTLLFLSLSAAFAIGSALESTPLGFLIVGGGYILVTLIAYFCRKSIVEKPVIKKLSEIIFND